jgi:hypothetical protein
MPHNVDSDSPFTKDSSHGISRDAIIFRLQSLERGQSRTFDKLDEISILIARMPSGVCHQSESCADMRETVEQMKINQAKQDGALLGGKAVLVALGATVGALVSMVGTYLSWRK